MILANGCSQHGVLRAQCGCRGGSQRGLAWPRGTVVAWGDDTYGQTSIPGILIPTYYVDFGWGGYWCSIQIGILLNRLLLDEITTWRCLLMEPWLDGGTMVFGQASPPSNLSNVVAITAGDLHSAALCSNGTVVVWGDDTLAKPMCLRASQMLWPLPPVISTPWRSCRMAPLLHGVNNTYGQLDVPPSATNAIGITVRVLSRLGPCSLHFVLARKLDPGWADNSMERNGQSAMGSHVTGPYLNVTSQGNSWTNIDMSAPAKFFRVRRTNY